MKTQWSSVKGLAGLALLSIYGCTTPDGSGQQPVGTTDHGAGSGSSGSVCSADPTWFAKPSTNFPVDADFPSPPTPNNPNCDFHKWAWQSFLALMSAADASDPNGPRRFEQLADHVDLFRPDGGGPKQGYPGRPKGDGPGYLLNQAGPNDNALFDQNKQLVYYSLLLNKTYWDFIVDNQYYELSKLQSVGTDTEFPVGTLELKVSWRVVSEGSTVYIKDAEKSYYVVDAKVPNYAVKNNRVVATDGTRSVKLAMVGMHVAGVVKGHPEFIWATFEQLGNAPNSESGSKPATTGPFGGKGPWSLYKTGTPSDQTNIFDTGAPAAPASITRLDPWGGGDKVNTTNIITLNDSVWAKLPKSRRLLEEYFEVGAIWTTGVLPLNEAGFQPGVDPSQVLKGSFQADNPQAGIANTTMETFTQFQNCFYCHNAGLHTVQVLQRDGTQKVSIVGAKPLNLSHFVVNYQAQQQLEKGGK